MIWKKIKATVWLIGIGTISGMIAIDIFGNDNTKKVALEKTKEAIKTLGW